MSIIIQWNILEVWVNIEKGGHMKITSGQIRKIYAVANEYGIDRDLLHEIVENETNKEHIKELSFNEAIKVIDRINGKKQSAKPDEEHMTYKQEAYIKGLAKDLLWIKQDGTVDEKRLNGFVSKFYGITSYKWLTRTMATKVIEGLKSLKNK